MSNYVKTTNFLRKDSLPDTDTDKIIRGSEFDTEFNNLVTAVASKANTVSPELTGVPRAPTAPAGTSSTQIATTAFVAQNAILRGMIVMWSGAELTIPAGYALCDGTNDTPDLRNRFVMGAGSTYAVDATGGSANAVIVSHNHTGSTNTTGNHSHTYRHPGAKRGAIPAGGYDVADIPTNQNTGASGNHSHTFTTATKGESGTNKNLPPYYAQAFIKKT